MAGGGKRIQINTQERAISPDINRLQSFMQKSVSEILRGLLNTSGGTDDLDAGGIAVPNSTLDNPVKAEIIEGLLVQPQSGLTTCFVTAGTAMMLAPDAGADDSNYKMVLDPGVLAGASIVIPPNPGGSATISVVECQWSDVISETDNRDIFNAGTGLFSASVVTKARQGALTYRVRTGTVGGGFASVGTAVGWLPLMVASAPAGSVNNDVCTFWDVRPLISDRVYGMSNLKQALPREHRVQGRVSVNAGVATLSGVFEKSLNNRRLGGRIRPGVPLTDAQSIDLIALANKDAAFPAALNWWNLYLCTPFGLPRWARYTDGPAGRVPRSPRGIPVNSIVLPDQYGNPVATINLPASTGLGGASAVTEAIHVLAGRTNPVGVVLGCVADGRTVTLDTSNYNVTLAGSIAAGTSTFAMVDNVQYPANARAIYVKIDWNDVANGATAGSQKIYQPTLTLYDSLGRVVSFIQIPTIWYINPTVGALTANVSFYARIPIVGDYPTATPTTRNIVLAWGTGTTPSTAPVMTVLGYDLGP